MNLNLTFIEENHPKLKNDDIIDINDFANIVHNMYICHNDNHSW